MPFDSTKASELIEQIWDDEITPTLKDYIEIPSLSPDFDENWAENGHLDEAVTMFMDWARKRPINGMSVARHDLEDRTPVILIDIEGTANGIAETILLYGHLDKQPDMNGWDEDLGPRTPVLRGNRLYGRGGADDGYAMFSALTAVQSLQEQGIAHGRIVILIEASEESGSPDLPPHVEALREKIGDVGLVICLDSGCGNYDQLWLTTSLRGIVIGTLKVEVLTEGVHSGSASGIVPDSSQIAYQLLRERLRSEFGLIKDPSLRVQVPAERLVEAQKTADVLGGLIEDQFPWASDHTVSADERARMLIDGTWMPAVTIIGVHGFPAKLEEAGNVLRPHTTLKLSIRIPPTMDFSEAAAEVKRLLEKDPIPGTRVTFDSFGHGANGWHAPILEEWLSTSVKNASQAFFSRPAMAMGEGGTIPFMGMLGKMFPKAQFVITGVLGPHSNAHGPNEFLHIPMAKRLTGAVAQIIYDHANR